MLEFDMPKQDEGMRYDRTIEALKYLIGKPARNATKFDLELTEGDILKIITGRIGRIGFKKRLALGCPISGELPHVEYSYKNNGTEITYMREISPETGASGFYKKGVLDLKKVTDALNENCEETLQIYKKSERFTARVFRGGEKCYFELCGRKVDEEKMKNEGFGITDAVSLALDFCGCYKV